MEKPIFTYLSSTTKCIAWLAVYQTLPLTVTTQGNNIQLYDTCLAVIAQWREQSTNLSTNNVVFLFVIAGRAHLDSFKQKAWKLIFSTLLKIQVKFFSTCCFMSCCQVHMSEKRKSARKEVGPVRWVIRSWTSNFLSQYRHIFKHSGVENKANHQLEDIILIYHQILRTDIKRDVRQSVIKIVFVAKMIVHSICLLNLG